MSMHIDSKSLWSDLLIIKERSPLIHNITNYVVMEQTANSLLALGASPVMAHALEEVEEVTHHADSLVLNIGTLSPSWVRAMLLAFRVAHAKAIPIVLDPVGSGATSYRTETANLLLNQGKMTAIRGNASEIVSLSEHYAPSKGVDSLLRASDYIEQAKQVAVKNECIVWMSGESDIVTDGHTLVRVHNGHFLMEKVTGMGCTATAIVAAFLAVNPDPLLGSVHAAILMGIAGEMAAKKAEKPGSFKLAFLDTIYDLSIEEIEERMRVEVL